MEYVGHPLVEVIDEQLAKGKGQQATGNRQSLSDKPVIALLPGSRKQEILKKLPIMLEVSKSFLNYQFIVAKAPGVEDAFYNDLLKDYSNVSYVSNQTYNLLLQAKPHW